MLGIDYLVLGRAVKQGLCAVLLLCFCFDSAYASESCSYQTYRWNTQTKQAEDIQTVQKPYAMLNDDEVDTQTGCSICDEDQRWIKVAELDPVKVCKVLANTLESILNQAVNRGFTISNLTGYRVGRTRGDLDADGKRTGFSNHSFGIAIDINSNSNGLYENCLQFGLACILRRGGKWQPDKDPESISAGSYLVNAMRNAGFKWGGLIYGDQKDFMHFSPDGY